MSYYATSDYDPDAELDPQYEAEAVAYERAAKDYLAAREALQRLTPDMPRDKRWAALDRYHRAFLALRVWNDALAMDALQPADLPNAFLALQRTA